MLRNSRLPHAMPPAVHRLPVHWPPARAARMALAICTLAAGAAPAMDAPPGLDAARWPRVFYTPQQRAAIEHARNLPPGGAAADPEAAAGAAPAEAAASEPASVLLQGTARGRHGATAWINGQMLQQGESYAGRSVHVLPDGRVRLSRAGAPDLVLRPGQQASTDGSERQDVLPPGALLESQGAPKPGFQSKPRLAGD